MSSVHAVGPPSDHIRSSVGSHLVAKDIMSDRLGSELVHLCAVCISGRLHVGADRIASDGLVSTLFSRPSDESTS